MRVSLCAAILLSTFLCGSVFAQMPTEAPAQTYQEGAPVPNISATNDVAEDITPTYEPMKFAVLQTLDKVTARTATVTLPIGQPSAVGPIFIEVKTCQKTPPTEQPESAAFLQVWEAKPKSHDKHAKKDDSVASQWVFSGWMFASSPALSAMNHPIYDVWVKDCTNSVATSKQK